MQNPVKKDVYWVLHNHIHINIIMTGHYTAQKAALSPPSFALFLFFSYSCFSLTSQSFFAFSLLFSALRGLLRKLAADAAEELRPKSRENEKETKKTTF